MALMSVVMSTQLLLEPQTSGRVVVLMGSSSDIAHCEKIKKACASFGIPCILRITSAHKGPDETLRIKAEYEGMLSFLMEALKVFSIQVGLRNGFVQNRQLLEFPVWSLQHIFKVGFAYGNW